MELTETVIGTEEIYNGKVVHLRVDTIRQPDGYESKREIVAHPGAVCVVPIKEDGTVLLVRQFRHESRPAGATAVNSIDLHALIGSPHRASGVPPPVKSRGSPLTGPNPRPQSRQHLSPRPRDRAQGAGLFSGQGEGARRQTGLRPSADAGWRGARSVA